jgi:hypothetical protein
MVRRRYSHLGHTTNLRWDRVPPNVKFEIDDAEEPWTWSENFFDLIHLRTMTGVIRDWDRLFEQAFRCAFPALSSPIYFSTSVLHEAYRIRH